MSARDGGSHGDDDGQGGSGSGIAAPLIQDSRDVQHGSPAPQNTLVAGRAKRSTAGNRMQALLDQHADLEEEDLFKEEDNDAEFADLNQQEDVFDSDFGDSSDDEGRPGQDPSHPADDEESGERELEAEEERRKKAARKQAAAKARLAPSVIRRPAKPKATLIGPGNQSNTPTPSKRITFAADAHDDSQSAENRRVSSRRATVQSARDTQARLQEAEERRLHHPMVRNPPKQNKRLELNQAELIELALEREEENRESLKEWLEGEEERKRQELVRERRQAPDSWIRWRSVRSTVQKIQEIEPQSGGDPDDIGIHLNSTASRGSVQQNGIRQSFTIGNDGAQEMLGTHDSVASESETTKGVVPIADDVPVAGGAPGANDVSSGDGFLADAANPERIRPLREASSAHADTPAADQDHVPTPQSSQGDAQLATENESNEPVGSAQTLLPIDDSASDLAARIRKATERRLAIEGPEEEQTAVMRGAKTFEQSAKENVPTQIDFTLDPVLQARRDALKQQQQQQQAAARPEAYDDEQETAEYESRNYISLHYSKGTPPSWAEQFSALFGSHTDWSSVTVVPSRNRPLRPRASLCPITGKMARYLDKRTGVAFADVRAARILASLPGEGFEWVELNAAPVKARQDGQSSESSPHGDATAAAGQEEKKKPGGRKLVRGKDALGRPEGFLTGFWLPARELLRPFGLESENPPATQAPSLKRSRGSVGTSTQSKRQAKGLGAKSSPASRQGATPALSISTTAPITHPLGLAPGDEKAVLAEALAIPTGTTRSGRARASLAAQKPSQGA